MALLALALVGLPAKSQSFQWPDSSRFLRALVNVNQFIETRPPFWFSQDKLVTDLNVVNVTPENRAAAPATYDRVRRLLLARGLVVGTYSSGTTVKPSADQDTYPASTVSLEEMPATARYVSSWPGQPRRKIIDVSDPATRHALQAGLKRLWAEFPAPLRFVDNAGVHPAVSHEQPWSDYVLNIREIRQIAAAQGSKAIFNLSLHVGFLSDQELKDLIEAVGGGGIALEMPWHARIQKSPADTQRAEQRYRQLLDSGMAVVMIPVGMKAEDLVRWVQTWRKPSDHVYISGVFWKRPDAQVFDVR